MKLEDEIKQKSFRNEYHKLAVNIMYTHGWLDYAIAGKLKQFDITPTQYNILRILRGCHPETVSIQYIKERMLDKMSDASRLIERLFHKEYIDRVRSKSDRRKVDVFITSNGLKLLSDIDKIDNEFDVVFKNLSKEEAKKVNILLDRLRG